MELRERSAATRPTPAAALGQMERRRLRGWAAAAGRRRRCTLVAFCLRLGSLGRLPDGAPAILSTTSTWAHACVICCLEQRRVAASLHDAVESGLSGCAGMLLLSFQSAVSSG